MPKSKFAAVMLILIFAALAATVVFQSLEMRDYNLFQTLAARFFK